MPEFITGIACLLVGIIAGMVLQAWLSEGAP